MPNKDDRFSILSLSGGGFRGLFTAQVLAELEEEAGKPIGRCFDLICGTSIGGILALAIGLEKPMTEVVAIMEECGSKIFPSRKKFCGLLRAKYSNVPLKDMAEEIFGNHRIAESRHRLMIPAVNFSVGSARFFKTAHHESFKQDYKIKMSDVAMATSAAPTYLPMYELGDSSGYYVDGGLVANDPGLFGIHEAVHFLRQDNKKIIMLSIGTMGAEFRRDASKTPNAGLYTWGTGVFLLTLSAQEKMVDSLIGHQLGDERYHRIDESPTVEQKKNIDLDIANKCAIDTLKSMGRQAGKVFIGSHKSNIFLQRSAEEFQPCHTLIGENYDANT